MAVGDGGGVRHREPQPQAPVPIVVDPHSEHIEARPLGGRCAGRPPDIDPRRLGGDQALGVVGDDLDAIVAGLQDQGAADDEGFASRRSGLRSEAALIEAERHAIDPPFDLADTTALVGDSCLHIDLLARDGRTGLRRDNLDRGSTAARDDLGEIEPGRGLLHLAVRVTVELLPHEVGPVERLIGLVDGIGLEPTCHAEQICALLERIEEALGSERDPLAAYTQSKGRDRFVRLGLQYSDLTAIVPDPT
jgi:hypothetical protein